MTVYLVTLSKSLNTIYSIKYFREIPNQSPYTQECNCSKYVILKRVIVLLKWSKLPRPRLHARFTRKLFAVLLGSRITTNWPVLRLLNDNIQLKKMYGWLERFLYCHFSFHLLIQGALPPPPTGGGLIISFQDLLRKGREGLLERGRLTSSNILVRVQIKEIGRFNVYCCYVTHFHKIETTKSKCLVNLCDGKQLSKSQWPCFSVYKLSVSTIKKA